MNGHEQSDENIDVYNIETQHDYEQSCRLLRQQIQLYLMQWRELFDAEDAIEQEYVTDPTPEGLKTEITIQSDRAESVELTAGPVHGDGSVTYVLDGSAPLQTTYGTGEKQVIVDDSPQDVAEYGRLYSLMQNMQACMTLELARRRGASESPK